MKMKQVSYNSLNMTSYNVCVISNNDQYFKHLLVKKKYHYDK